MMIRLAGGWAAVASIVWTVGASVAMPPGSGAWDPPGVSAVTDSFRLRYRLEPGSSYRMLSESTQETTQDIGGYQVSLRQSMTLGLRFDVILVDPQATATIRVTYETVRLEIESPSGPFVYDSSVDDARVPPLAAPFAALPGRGYTFALAGDGSILTITDVDSVLLGGLGGVPGVSIVGGSEVGSRDGSFFSAATALVLPFPDHAIAQGESWSRAADTGEQAGGGRYESTWTLGATDDDTALITTRVDIRSRLGGPEQDHGEEGLYDFRGEVSGWIEVDRASGWVRRSESAGELSGVVRLPGHGGPPEDWPVTIHASTKSEIRDRP